MHDTDPAVAGSQGRQRVGQFAASDYVYCQFKSVFNFERYLWHFATHQRPQECAKAARPENEIRLRFNLLDPPPLVTENDAHLNLVQPTVIELERLRVCKKDSLLLSIADAPEGELCCSPPHPQTELDRLEAHLLGKLLIRACSCV